MKDIKANFRVKYSKKCFATTKYNLFVFSYQK